MKSCIRRASLPLFLFVLLSVLPGAVLADTYQEHLVAVHRGYLRWTPLGLTADGTFVDQFDGGPPYQTDPSPCPANSAFCYLSYTADVGFTSATACTPGANGACNPGIAFDNGSPCTISVPSFPGGPAAHQAPGICNNGHEIPSGGPTGYFYLNDGVLSLGPPTSGPEQSWSVTGPLFVNAEGDFAFTGSSGGPSYEDFLFIDETSRLAATPEPSSFLLLGTGLALAASILRRRGRSTN